MVNLVLPTCSRRITAVVLRHACIAVGKALRTLRLMHVCAAGIQEGRLPLHGHAAVLVQGAAAQRWPG